MILGQRIRYYRLLNKLSQDELGKKIDSDARMVSHYENEKYKPSTDAIILLAKAFGITIDELLVGYSGERSDDQVQQEWSEILGRVVTLPEEDREALKKIIEYLISKSQPRQRVIKSKKKLAESGKAG